MSEILLNRVGIRDTEHVKNIIENQPKEKIDFSKLPSSLERCIEEPDTKPNTFRVCASLIAKKGASASEILGRKHTDIGSVSARCYRSLQQDMLGARLPSVNIEAKVHDALGYGIPNLKINL